MNPNQSTLKYCVYLLTSLDPRYKYHTYIGKTVNPPRRLRQHNGEISGGAFKTEGKRPWQMVLVVHSFPTQTKVLQFEWDWQHPEKGKRVRSAYDNILGKGFGNMHTLKFKIRLLAEMLRQPSYSRLPLGIYVTTHSYDDFLEGCPSLPSQITLHYGELNNVTKHIGTAVIDKMRKKKKCSQDNIFRNLHGMSQSILSQLIEQLSLDKDDAIASQQNISRLSSHQHNQNTSSSDNNHKCYICSGTISPSQKSVSCIYKCGMNAHLICLGKAFTEGKEMLIPTTSSCPKCGRSLRWGDLIKFLKNKRIETFN
ncbi:Structure-specific endonuclease subunit SLX1-like protein [Entamoeba marina]